VTVDVTKLRALCEAATPGPWKHDLDMFDIDDGYEACVADDHVELLARIDTGVECHKGGEKWTSADSAERDARCVHARSSQAMRDAALIAAARTALPACLDEIEHLRAALAEALDIARECDIEDSGDCIRTVARLQRLAAP